MRRIFIFKLFTIYIIQWEYSLQVNAKSFTDTLD